VIFNPYILGGPPTPGPPPQPTRVSIRSCVYCALFLLEVLLVTRSRGKPNFILLY